MVGKAALIVILGFSLIFGIAGQYWNRTNDRAMENFYNYFDSTASHELAISAANILADTIFWANSFGGTLKNIDLGTRSFAGAKYRMFTQPDTVDGDSCILAAAYGMYTSTSGKTINDTVEILLRPGRFCTWAFFTGDDNGVYWKTNDTCFGNYHTNTRLCVDGAPVFKGNVTVGTGLTGYVGGNVATPSQLRGGDTLKANSYETGDILPLPSSLGNYNSITAATIFNDTTSTASGKKYAYDVYFTFNGANVSYYTQVSSVTTNSGTTATITNVRRIPASGSTTVPITSFGNAGGQGQGSVVIVQNGDIHISGPMDGRVTFVSEQTTTTDSATHNRISSSAFDNTNNSYDCNDANGNTKNGNVIIGGDITYVNPPANNSDVRDELALISDNSIMIGTRAAGTSTTIDAQLFARQGKFFAQNYSGSNMGSLNVFGCIGQNIRGAVGLVSGAGYTKHYTYDQRFGRTLTSPPYSPSTGSYNILSWRE